jgi:hypothetical protein
MPSEATPPTTNIAVERKPAWAGVMWRSRTMSGMRGAWFVNVIDCAPATMQGKRSDGVRSVARAIMPVL